MAHENLERSHNVEGSSNRSFGIVFTIVFLVIAGWPLIHGGQVRWWAAWTAAGFALTAALKPSLLGGANRLWMRFGLLLGSIVSPIALGIIFYLAITPLGLLMRLTGKDPLRLRLDRQSPTYWISRTPPGPPPDSMNNQF